MKKRKILKGATVLLIAAAMVFSTVALADTQIKQDQITLNTSEEGSGVGARGAIVWDNFMNYDGLAAAQYDVGIAFDTFQADDFHFEEPTEVCDVHWIAGYWGTNYQQGAFDYAISFYVDDGSGTAPLGHPFTPSYAGPFQYTWAQCNPIFIDDTGSSIYYECSVDLPENIPFEPCVKYWISIWGIGAYPPQSGWGYHQDPILIQPAVWGSDYFGFVFWTPGFDVLGHDFDMCFQLTTKEDPLPPTPPVIDGPPCGHVGTNYTYTFHSDDPNGDMVRYHIDWGDGSPPETTGWHPPCTPVSVTHTYTTQGTFTISAYAEDATGLTSPVSTYVVEMPRDKAINFPFLYYLFQMLLQRLGL
jgi:hypothetical protein